MKLIEYPDAEMMMLDLAQVLADELEEVLHHDERATLAVPGGTTPGPIFDSLSAIHLPWDRVTVMLTDERWVEESSPRSNSALVKSRLLTGAAAAARYQPLYTGDATPEDGLERLRAEVDALIPLSVCLLGMGADMHTASLFPGGDNLNAALHLDRSVWPMRAGGADEPRVTLSAHTLQSALRRHIVITGPEKREALERARHLPPIEAPIAAVLDGATVHWAAS